GRRAGCEVPYSERETVLRDIEDDRSETTLRGHRRHRRGLRAPPRRERHDDGLRPAIRRDRGEGDPAARRGPHDTGDVASGGDSKLSPLAGSVSEELEVEVSRPQLRRVLDREGVLRRRGIVISTAAPSGEDDPERLLRRLELLPSPRRRPGGS